MIHLLKRSSIRAQMLAAMLIVGVVTLVLVTLQSLHCAHEGLMDMQSHTFSLFLAQQRAQIDSWIDDRASALRLIAGSPLLHEGLRNNADADRFLKTTQEHLSHVEVLALYNLDGELVAKGPSTSHADGELLEPSMLQAMRDADGVVWSKDAHIHGPDYMAVHAATPVFDADGNRAGYLAASIMLNEAARVLYETAVGDSSMKSYLVDLETGRYLSVPLSMREELGELATGPVESFQGPATHHAHHGQRSELRAYADARGVSVIGLAEALPQYRWLLVVEMDQAEAFAMLRFLLHRAGLSGLVVIALIIILALASAKLLARPLQSVTATCQRVAGGSFEQRLPAQPGREANDLADAFNTMLDRLDTTQQQLVQAGALAAVGELSASIVHEMRNPLNTIQMNLQAMRRKLADDDKLTELHQLAQRQTGRLQNMLSNLLAYSKPVELDIRSQPLAPIVLAGLTACEALATEHGVAFKPQLPETPVTAAVDAEYLERVLINLIENAIHVQPAGGEVEITLRQAADGAVIEVSDRGPGLPEGMQEKAFRPFFTTRAAGTGLGLSIVKKILDLHHGSIAVTSREGTGATFTIWLSGRRKGNV